MQEKAPPESGVLGEDALRRLTDGSPVPVTDTQLSSVGSVAAVAERIGMGSVFILPGSTAASIARSGGFWTTHETWNSRGLSQARGVPTAVQLRRDGRTVVVVDLARDTRWQALRSLDQRHAATALRYVQVVLGRPPSYSPGFLGRALIESSLHDPLWLRPLTKRLPALQAANLGWASAVPAGASWVHLADVNAAYLTVAKDQSFGVGDPISRTELEPAELAHAYAFCQVEATPRTSVWDGVRFPSPFGRPGAVSGWWAAPHVRAAHELGWHVHISRALVWPERHKVMHAWARDLWEGRAQLSADRRRFPNEVAAVAAQSILKAIYVQTISLLSREPSGGGELEAPAFVRLGARRWTRPDWRAWIIGECHRRRLWEIRRLGLAGRCVVAADVDALAVASPLADAQAAAPELRWGGLGGYKVAASVPGSIARGLQARGAGASTFADALKEAARGTL